MRISISRAASTNIRFTLWQNLPRQIGWKNKIEFLPARFTKTTVLCQMKMTMSCQITVLRQMTMLRQITMSYQMKTTMLCQMTMLCQITTYYVK